MAQPERDERAVRQAISDLDNIAGYALGGVEGLDQASCSSRVKHLAEIGIGAAARGCSWQGWRHEVSKAALYSAAELDEAEECMQQCGLWPWD